IRRRDYCLSDHIYLAVGAVADRGQRSASDFCNLLPSGTGVRPLSFLSFAAMTVCQGIGVRMSRSSRSISPNFTKLSSALLIVSRFQPSLSDSRAMLTLQVRFGIWQ